MLWPSSTSIEVEFESDTAPTVTSHPIHRSKDVDLPGFCGERLAHFPGVSLEGDGALEAER
jgi:hypothetical protein